MSIHFSHHPVQAPLFGTKHPGRTRHTVAAAAVAVLGGAACSAQGSNSAASASNRDSVCVRHTSAGSADLGSVAFDLTLPQANALLRAADGMIPNSKPEWKNYPQRSENPWGAGFTDAFAFQAAPNDKEKADGVVSFKEAQLAAHQLNWDGQMDAQKENDCAVNAVPISPKQAKNAETFFESIFWNNKKTSPPGLAGAIRSGLDDGDQQFTEKDLEKLASYDQNGHITNDAFDRSFLKNG